MNRVLDPFVLEHVPNFVDVAFVEDVVNHLKERSTEKIDSEQWQLNAKDYFSFLHRAWNANYILVTSFKQYQFIQKNISFSISTVPLCVGTFLENMFFLS